MIRFLPSFIRILNPLLKGLFAIILLNLLSLEDIGSYGLINSSITILSYFLGLELWQVYNRISSKIYDENHIKFVENVIKQLFSYSLIYIISLPIIFIYFFYSFNEIHLLVLGILVTSHLSLELSRILNFIDLQLQASIVLFFCQALWIMFILVLFFAKVEISLTLILTVNFTISLFFTFSSWAFFLHKNKFTAVFTNIEWKDIITFELVTNFKKSLNLFVGVICIYISLYITRYYLEYKHEGVKLGVFTYLQSIAGFVLLIVELGFSLFITPYLIRLNPKELHRAKTKIIIQNITWSLISFLAVYLAGLMLFKFLTGNKIILDYKAAWFTLCLSYFFYSISTIFSLLLYTIKKDNYIVNANILSALLVVAYIVCLDKLNYFQSVFKATTILLFFGVCQSLLKFLYYKITEKKQTLIL